MGNIVLQQVDDFSFRQRPLRLCLPEHDNKYFRRIATLLLGHRDAKITTHSSGFPRCLAIESSVLLR